MIDFTDPAQLRAANERIAREIMGIEPQYIDDTFLVEKPGEYWPSSWGPRKDPPDYMQPAELLRVMRKICSETGYETKISMGPGNVLVQIRWNNLDGIALAGSETFEQAAFSAIMKYLDREGGKS